MERTNELAINHAVVRAQLAAAMQAYIVHRADRAIILPHDKIGSPCVFIDDVVAGIGQVFFATDELPDIGPDTLAF